MPPRQPPWRSSPGRERAPATMSWQPSLCQEAGDIVTRLLGGAVLLCVVSNAVFLFYLPSRRRRDSDGRRQAPRMESGQPADSREGGQAGQHVPPEKQRSETPSTDRRRSSAGQRSGGGPDGRLGPVAIRPQQRRKPVVLFVPGRASQAAGSLWPPVPDKPLQATADAPRVPKVGLEPSGPLPRPRDLVAALRHGQ